MTEHVLLEVHNMVSQLAFFVVGDRVQVHVVTPGGATMHTIVLPRPIGHDALLERVARLESLIGTIHTAAHRVGV